MLEPPLVMKEAGFSLHGEDVASPVGWSPELIASLDWMRLAELARAIASNAGCELAGSRVFEDGSVLFAMFEQPKSPQRRRALVKLVGWNDWSATPQMVEAFARELHTACDARGVLIAPGGFTPAASHAAAEHQIEPVDAARLCSALASIEEERSDFFYLITTAGDFSTPTCPVCLTRMTLDQQVIKAEPRTTHSDYLFRSSAIVADPVVCRKLEVSQGVEVKFLREVRAHEIIVHGHVTGDFVCEGRLTLGGTATLVGTVAARAVDVRDGGELCGQTRILEAVPQPITPVRQRWQWACHNPMGKPNCARVVFASHK